MCEIFFREQKKNQTSSAFTNKTSGQMSDHAGFWNESRGLHHTYNMLGHVLTLMAYVMTEMYITGTT